MTSLHFTAFAVTGTTKQLENLKQSLTFVQICNLLLYLAQIFNCLHANDIIRLLTRHHITQLNEDFLNVFKKKRF